MKTDTILRTTISRAGRSLIRVAVLLLALATPRESFPQSPDGGGEAAPFVFAATKAEDQMEWMTLSCDKPGESQAPLEARLATLLGETDLSKAEREQLGRDVRGFVCYFAVPTGDGYRAVVDPDRRRFKADTIEKSRKAVSVVPIFQGRVEHPESAPMAVLAGAMLDGFHAASKSSGMKGTAVSLPTIQLRLGSLGLGDSTDSTKVLLPHPGSSGEATGARLYDTSVDISSELNELLESDGVVRFCDVIAYVKFDHVPSADGTPGGDSTRVLPVAMRFYHNSRNSRWYPVNGYLGVNAPRMIII